MNKKIALLLAFVSCVFISNTQANIELQTLKQFSKTIENVRNPFEQQLPVEVVEPEEIPTEVEFIIAEEEVEEQKPSKEELAQEQREKERQLEIAQKLEEIKRTENIVLPTLDINGLVWNSTRPQAIINGNVLDVGDSIFDITITSISKSLLEVTYQGAKFKILP